MKLITLVLLLSISFCFSQRSYMFDTFLEYDCKSMSSNGDSTITKYLYTNSKDNSYYIIIKDKTESHLPILIHPTAYNEWKKEKNIPNGIYEQFMFYDFNNKLSNHYKLKRIKRVKLKLNVAKPCPPMMIITN